MYVVYAIESLSNGRIYFGQTKDLSNRLKLHNGGKVRSTRIGGPWQVIATETFPTRSEAMNLEWKIKKSRGIRLKWLEQNRVAKKFVQHGEGKSEIANGL